MMHLTLHRLFELPRPIKRLLQVATDTVLLALSFGAAMLMRTESLDFVGDRRVWAVLVAALPFTLIVFVKLGFYRAVIRYMGSRALVTITAGVAAAASALGAMSVWLDLPVPPAVPFIFALVAFCTVGGVRFALRTLYLKSQSRLKPRVIIYGAGQSGRQLLHSLAQGPDYAPVAFVDDAPELHGTQIGGMMVFPPSRLERLIDEYGARAVLLAVPSSSLATRAAILARLENLPIRVQTIPGMADIVSGRSRLSEIREVTVEDLLGRDPVPPSATLMSANIEGKAVLVSGAGGSIGSELCRLILRERPRVIVLLELSEYALYEIERELSGLVEAENLPTRLIPVLGNVRDGSRVRAILRQWNVQTIYHAAAYKHVPLVETNVIEGLRNNLFGTVSMAQAAQAEGVENFILLSTDKAVRPSNVMGASKRMSELVCQALAMGRSRTRFSMVRFGNVLGSSGSVIPLFRRQIKAGGPVTVTHPEITRYFMTITEAAQLVIQAGAMARGGDVFVLDMGQPVRIADLAMRMVRLSGFTPVIETEGSRRALRGADTIPIAFTRLRPGEKLYEELLIGASDRATMHPRIRAAQEVALDWAALSPILTALDEACAAGDELRIRAILREAPTGYAPSDDTPSAGEGRAAARVTGAKPGETAVARRDRPAPEGATVPPALVGSAGS